MPTCEKCPSCRTVLVWATILGRSVLVCPKATCCREATS